MAERMNEHEIIKLLENLIGPVEARGDSSADEKVLKNLKTLIDVTNWCLDSVYQSSWAKNRIEGSMKEIGETAFSALYEWQEWLIENTMDGKT